MRERFRRGEELPETGTRSSAATTTVHETTGATRVDDVRDTPLRDPDARGARFHRDHDLGHGAPLDRTTMRDVRARQREEFGGIHWGSSFFGWLSAMGLATILLAIVSAAGASLAVGQNADNGDAGTIGIAGGIAMLVVLAVAGAVLGAEYNVLEQLNLPRIPVDEGNLATGALIALAIGLVTTLLAALAGGKAGERFHRKVDRAAIAD